MSQKNNGVLVPKEIEAGRPLYIATFKNEKDNAPHCEELQWDNVCRILGSHRIRDKKDGGPVWSPVQYAEGSTRGNDSVIDIHLAVLDIDGGISLEEFKQRLEGYAYLLHTSFSHKEDHPKFRVILPLTSPVKVSDWHDAWQKINAKFGGANDPACKDPARVYFVPARRSDASGHEVVIRQGRWLDVGSLPTLSVEAGTAPTATTTPPPPGCKMEIEGIEVVEDLSPHQGLVSGSLLEI